MLAFVSSVRDVTTDAVDLDRFTMDDVESNIVRCPDQAAAEKMIAAIDEARPRASGRPPAPLTPPPLLFSREARLLPRG